MNKVIKSALFFAFFYCVQIVVSAQNLGAYRFNSSTNATTVAANCSFTPATLSGGLTATTASNRYNLTSTTWPSSKIISRFTEFTITANTGYELSINSISFNQFRSPNGPRNMGVTYTTSDGQSADKDDIVPTTTSTAVSWSALGITVPVNGSITFYLYGWNPTSGSSQTLIVDEIVVGGTVSLSSTPFTMVNLSSLGFGNTVFPTPSASQAISVSGANLTDDVILTPPSGFEIRTGSNPFSSTPLTLVPSSGTLASTTVDVRFNPSSAGVFSGDITIESAGTTTLFVDCSGTALAPQPAAPQPTLSVSNINQTTMDLTFTGGTGSGVLILIRQGAAVTSPPVDGTTYTASTTFGAGSDISSNFVLYTAASGSTITVSGLSPSTVYHFAAYAYNGGPGTFNYLTSNPRRISAATVDPVVNTYTWNQTGSASWTVPTNWTPTRSAPGISDILRFENGENITVTNVPATETIGELLIFNNTQVNITPAGASSLITISGGVGEDFSVEAGSSLILTSGSFGLSFLATTSLEIAGTVNFLASAGAIRAGSTVPFTLSGRFITSNLIGFTTGTAATRSISANIVTTIIDEGTVEYNASAGTQVISNRVYRNLVFSGASTKSVSGTTEVERDFTVSGGSVTVASGSTFRIDGASENQSFAGLNFVNLIVTAGGTKTLTSPASVSGTLTVTTSGTVFQTSDQLTLTSTASGTARVAQVTSGASITGNVTVQSFIPAKAGRYWYHITSPVSGGTATVANLQDDLAITGPFTGASNPGNGINRNGVSMYTYNASTGDWAAFPSASNAETMSRVNGYRMFVRDGSASLAPSTTAKTLDLTGTLNVGTQTYSLAYSPVGGSPAGGWNFIGNPYFSNITGNVNNAGWNITGVSMPERTIYTWDSDAAAYTSCVDGVGACTISPFQGFWVRVASAGSITIGEAAKLNASSPLMRIAENPEEEKSYISLVMRNRAIEGNKDVFYLRQENLSTNSFDGEYDAHKMVIPGSQSPSQAFGVYAVQGSQLYSIMTNPEPAQEGGDTVQLAIWGAAGNYTFNVNDWINQESAELEYYLEDSFLDSVTQVTDSLLYNFEITSDTSSKNKRFRLVYVAKKSAPTEPTSTLSSSAMGGIQISPNPIGQDNQFELVLSGSPNWENVKVEVTNTLGQTISSELSYASGGNACLVQLPNELISGVYIVQVSEAGKPVQALRILKY